MKSSLLALGILLVGHAGSALSEESFPFPGRYVDSDGHLYVEINDEGRLFTNHPQRPRYPTPLTTLDGTVYRSLGHFTLWIDSDFNAVLDTKVELAYDEDEQILRVDFGLYTGFVCFGGSCRGTGYYLDHYELTYEPEE